MHNQPKFLPQRGTDFYADGRSARPQAANTVSRGQMQDDTYFYTGLVGGREGDSLPFPATAEVLERGQERYNVYCTPCHSRIGNGAGMIVQRGYAPAGNLLGTRLRAAGLGHFFQVMTHGYGAMPDYAAQLTPADRWAVAAYIRALQLSQNAQASDVPSGTKVMSLAAIARTEGLPESFAAEWDTIAAAPVPVVALAGSPAVPAIAAAGAAAGAATPAVVPKKPLSVADLQAGRETYVAKCQVCHKADLGGRAPMFPSLVGAVPRLGTAHVRRTIQQGQPPMPAFADLSAKELDDLIGYIADPSKADSAPEAN